MDEYRDTQEFTGLRNLAMELECKFDAEIERDPDVGKKAPYDHSANNWASQLGHPCRRFLVYSRLDWERRKEMSTEGRHRVKEGKRIETWLQHKIEDFGYPIVENQKRVTWPDLQISGKIDGKIRVGDILPILEIKSVNPRYWDSTRSLAAIAHNSAYWIRMIVTQPNLYMFMENEPWAMLALATFGKRPRFIPMHIDFDLGDKTVETARAVNEHVAAGTYPQRIFYHPQVCGLCDFSHLCKPMDVRRIDEITDEDGALLERYCDLEEGPVEEYKILKSRLIGEKKKPGAFRGKRGVWKDIEIKTTGTEARMSTKIKRVPKREAADAG